MLGHKAVTHHCAWNEYRCKWADNTSLTVTVNGSGNRWNMSVSGSIGISGTAGAFYEEGEGVYSATITAGTVAGSDSVSIDIVMVRQV